MQTYYLVDYENVHNEGMEKIKTLSETDHVYIFYTENAPKISMDTVFTKNGVDIIGYKTPTGNQSLDKHLVAYLGFLLGKDKEKKCSYVIISKDKDYDSIIKFWKEEGYTKVSRKQEIPDSKEEIQKKTVQKKAIAKLSGQERTALNAFMQHGLRDLDYTAEEANRICKCVVKHCNDEDMLSEIYNELSMIYKKNVSKVFEAVKSILVGFAPPKSKDVKRESQVRSFFGEHFKEKIYTDKKEKIIQIILGATSRQQLNNGLMKLYADGSKVSRMLQTMQPLIKDLPGSCKKK